MEVERIIRNITHHYFFYLFAFTLFFGVSLYHMAELRFTDELSGVLLLIAYVIFLYRTKNRNFHPAVLIIPAVFMLDAGYSFYLSHNTSQAILLDFLIQLRPYATFFIVSQLAPSLSDVQKQQMARLCLLLWLLFLPIGAYGLYLPDIYRSVMNRPENFVAVVSSLSLVYLYCSDFSTIARRTFLVMLSASMLASPRFIGLFLLICGIVLYFNHRSILNSWIRTGIATGVVVWIATYIFYIQIASYLSPSDAQGGSLSALDPQAILYQAALKVWRDFPLFGSGLASFATYASGLYYSPLYAEYGVHTVSGLAPHAWHSVCDTYYPSLVQFGVTGIVLFLLFWTFIVCLSLWKYKRHGDIQLFVTVLITACILFIGNISDSLFTSHKGYFMMMFLGLLAGNLRQNKCLTKTTQAPSDELLSEEPLWEERIETETASSVKYPNQTT
ncbi:MAG: O-antigen ligase family protein [Tannerella sp.]|nr:O-antigen ligase family protein [Tannerella sp.]